MQELLKNEFWTVVINGSSNIIIAIVSFCQLILLYLTFKIGSDFLSQHKKKVGVENKEKYALELLNCLNDLELTIDKLISRTLRDSEQIKSFIPRWNGFNNVNILQAWCIIIHRKIEDNYSEIKTHFLQVRKYGFLLQDLELQDNIIQIESSVKLINKSFVKGFGKVDRYMIEIREVGFQFYDEKVISRFGQEIPQSIYDKSIPSVSGFLILKEEIKNCLKKYIN